MPTKHKAKTHARRPQPQQQPRQEVLAATPAKLVDDGRKQSLAIIDTLSKTAMTLASGDDAANKVAVIERLWAMQKDAEDRQAEREFGIAKVALAMQMPTIKKTKMIEFVEKASGKLRQTPYADRVAIEDALDPLCKKHGFSKEYSTDTVNGMACQVLTVRHVAGHKEVFKSPYMPLDTGPGRNNLQAAGSTSEYGKRYALIGAFNVIGVDKDDDGNLGDDTGAPKADKFTARVGEQSGNADVIDAKPTQADKEAERTTLEIAQQAASKLEDKMLAAEPERRGQIFMANVRLVKELEILGDPERAAHLRSLVEGNANAQ